MYMCACMRVNDSAGESAGTRREKKEERKAGNQSISATKRCIRCENGRIALLIYVRRTLCSNRVLNSTPKTGNRSISIIRLSNIRDGPSARHERVCYEDQETRVKSMMYTDIKNLSVRYDLIL